MATDTHKEFSISIQVTMLFIAIILFFIYYFHLFVYEKHNRLALSFSIVMFAWFITIIYRYWCTKDDDKQHIKHINLLEIPYSIKCTIGAENCAKGDASTWIVIHFVIYVLIGLFVPDCYVEILVISIACELIEAGFGHISKFIVDPMVNMAGYIIGSALSRNKHISSLQQSCFRRLDKYMLHKC